jgi:hypothetical protein
LFSGLTRIRRFILIVVDVPGSVPGTTSSIDVAFHKKAVSIRIRYQVLSREYQVHSYQSNFVSRSQKQSTGSTVVVKNIIEQWKTFFLYIKIN